MYAIVANDLKTQGVSSLEEDLQSETEAMITMRGKQMHVVMLVAYYHYLREMEEELL